MPSRGAVIPYLPKDEERRPHPYVGPSSKHVITVECTELLRRISFPCASRPSFDFFFFFFLTVVYFLPPFFHSFLSFEVTLREKKVCFFLGGVGYNALVVCICVRFMYLVVRLVV